VDDTWPEARRIQIELLRAAGPERRARMASALTNQALWRARRGIALARPDLSELERRLLFVEVHYGGELARRVRACLAARPAARG
jgi:hypothetical protein